MNQSTILTLKKLEAASWFSHVGHADTDKAIVLKNWDEAIAHCESVEWENLCLEAVNNYWVKLSERQPDRLGSWNDLAGEIKRISIPLVKSKIASVVTDNSLPKVFEDVVQWDILHVCMEAEYADIYPPGFYAGQAYWYVNGHFPCGWKGDFPSGTLIIY